MKVLKFGGTSVGSAERMQSVVKLISDGESKIVVLSAMSGTTNALIEFTNYLTTGPPGKSWISRFNCRWVALSVPRWLLQSR